MKSIKVDEETYKLLLKLKYEHAMRGVKVTFSDLVKGLLLGACHSSKAEKKTGDSCGCTVREGKSEKQSVLV